MAESIQNLALVVDDSKTKLILACECTKGQEKLAHNIKTETQRLREICKSSKYDNQKLENEIRYAEENMKSLITAHETMKSANAELKKDLSFCTKNNIKMDEHLIKLGKKNEDLMQQSKNRYETLSYVKKWKQANKKCETIKNSVNTLENKAKVLKREINNKKNDIEGKDKNKIIELAAFFVNEMPCTLKMIKDKSAEVEKLINEIKMISEKKIANSSSISTVSSSMSKLNLQATEDIVILDDWPYYPKVTTYNQIIMMPKLCSLNIVELDTVDAKCDQKKKANSQCTNTIKRTDSDIELEGNKNKKSKNDQKLTEEYISLFFKKPMNVVDNELENQADYSKRKLINILTDFKIDNNETYNIISKVNTDQLKGVNVITAKQSDIMDCDNPKKKNGAPMESEEIEELDLTNPSQNILIPPTQFLDVTQETVKRVSFDLPLTVQEVTDGIVTEDIDKTDENAGNEANETMNSELDISSITDEKFMKITDMILKKHNLDSSPQFFYAKNTTVQKKNDDRIVTSKFFDQTNTEGSEAVEIADENKMECDNTHSVQTSQMKQGSQPIAEAEKNPTEDNLATAEDANITNICSQKDKDLESPVTGFLFSHGPQGIPDTLDISMSTTGYEEGDDFPHYLDNSLLLSPKADLPMHTSGDNNEVGSQEVPNFLAGFKKTGLSFFGKKLTAEVNPESNANNQENNYNFNFGRDEKKNRTGLFSFFQ